MKTYFALILLALCVAVGGCAADTHSTPADSTASAAAQPAAQPSSTQDRDARIKESNDVRRSMGY